MSDDQRSALLRWRKRRESAVFAGGVLVVVGLVGWDWRLAAVVTGILVAAAGMIGLIREHG